MDQKSGRGKEAGQKKTGKKLVTPRINWWFT